MLPEAGAKVEGVESRVSRNLKACLLHVRAEVVVLWYHAAFRKVHDGKPGVREFGKDIAVNHHRACRKSINELRLSHLSDLEVFNFKEVLGIRLTLHPARVLTVMRFMAVQSSNY